MSIRSYTYSVFVRCALYILMIMCYGVIVTGYAFGRQGRLSTREATCAKLLLGLRP